MRYFLSGVALLASGVFIAACCAMNWFFWIDQGRTALQGQLLGLISIAVDLFVCVIPFFVGRAVQNKRMVYAWSWRALFTIFFIFSFISALGFAASNRSVKSEGREAINRRLADAEAQLQEREHSRPKIAGHRPSGVVQALIEKVQQDKRYQGSQRCAVPWPEARKFCQDVADLKVELANAQEDDRLAADVRRLKQDIVTLAQSGGGQPRDAQAALMATLTGFKEHTAENILSVAVALLVELGAAFGLYLATGWLPAPTEEKSPRGRDVPEPEPKLLSQASEMKVFSDHRPSGLQNDEPVAKDIPLAEAFPAVAPPKPRKERKKRTSKKNLENLKPMRLQIGEDGALRAKGD
jgi:hypothetical protein